MTKLTVLRAMTLTAAIGALVAPVTIAAQARSKPSPKAVTGIRGDVLKDLEFVENKFSGLAKAMSGKYQWRPADKVRSFGEVLQHVSGENYALPMVLGAKPPAEFKAANVNEGFGLASEMEKVTDEAAIQAEITRSFAHIRQAVTALRDTEMNAPVKIFGMNTTKRGFLLLINNHMHEHLGQLIAYARMNGVVPPWSAQSDS